jgi:hypothetical protein
MSETVTLSTKTTLSISGSSISIYTYYNDDEDSATITAFLSSLSQTINGVSFEEGEGGITTEDTDNVFYLNSNNDGDLLILGDDAENYFLDEDTGQLYYYYDE